MRFLTWYELADRLTVSVSTAKRLHKENENFPRRVQISAKRVGFPESEVNEYMEALVAARDAA